MIFLYVCACDRTEPVQEHYYDDVHEYFYDVHGVEMTDELITLEKAKECYFSCESYGLFDLPHPSTTAEYMHYKHTLIPYNETIDCCIFDIEGYENLKFYSFIEKGYSNIVFSTQTLFVDESLKEKEINLSVGDDVSQLKAIFPDAQDLNFDNEKIRDRLKKYMPREEVDDFCPDTEYYEILGKNGVFRYDVDESGKIISKQEINDKFALGVTRYYSN